MSDGDELFVLIEIRLGASKKIRASIPWWMRISGKLILSRLPISDRTWQRLGLFSSGNMLDPKYAIAVFEKHFLAANRPPPGFTFLELGPGDSLASAVIGCAFGAARGWLVGSEAYVSRDMAFYARLIEEVKELETPVSLPSGRRFENLEELLAICNVKYCDKGLASLAQIPDESCDMVFSQAVLEHVRKQDFAAVIGEIYRILKPGAASSHDVDFQDHLGGSLNHLRFSDGLWEASWFADRSGFYTNRILLSEMTRMVRRVGFELELIAADEWLEIPLSKRKLDSKFRSVCDIDLRTSRAYFKLCK